MATAQAMARTQDELRRRADYGATFGELLDHLDEQNRTLGRGRFSGDQEEELQLYCWAFPKCKSSGVVFGATRVWGTLEDDIGA
jgi:DNA-binding IclR family transcriptional regulator